LWRILFFPSSGISHAGLMFPLVLALALLLSASRCARALYLWLRRHTPPGPLDAAALMILCGWMLYFRSALGAGAAAGDLAFIRYDLNSLRYAEGVLAASELFLAALFQRIAPALVGANLASRLILLYGKIPAQLFPLSFVLAVAAAVLLALLAASRLRPQLRAAICLGALLVCCPFLVEKNRELWTPYWNDLKPVLAELRPHGLAVLALTDGGYFAGQVVAAGNPVDPSVRAFLPEQMDALPESQRPPYLAVLFSPGSEGESTWRTRYAPDYIRWGYTPMRQGKEGLLLKKNSVPALLLFHRVHAHRTEARSRIEQHDAHFFALNIASAERARFLIMDSKETRGTSMSLRTSAARSKRWAALGMRSAARSNCLEEELRMPAMAR